MKTVKPSDHKVWFTGDRPCNKEGKFLDGIHLNDTKKDLGAEIIALHEFSNKPPEGYPDYHSKMTRYVAILQAPARSIDPLVTAQTHKTIQPREEESVFLYADSASK
jgi:hypothetical protein